MWHHRSVFRFCSLGAGAALLWLASLSPAGSAQQHARLPSSAPRAHAEKTPTPPNPLTELENLIQAQQTAVQGGDPAQIAATSRALNAQIYSLLAQFRLAGGKPQDAIALYEQSLDQDPSTERRLEFASALLRFGNSAAALKEADAVLAVEPENAAAWMTRGSALKSAGRNQEAVDALIHALKLRPEPNVAFSLGSTYLSLHQKDKASDLFQRLLKASDEAPIWYVAIGDAYRDAGYMDDALTNLKTAVARDPKVLHGEFFLGLTYLQMNQWGPNSDSFQHLRKAVALSPHEYVSNFYLGALESTDGSDLPSSDRHLRAAADADPSQPEVWLYLGMNANREKRTADAKTYLQNAIDLTGNDEARNNYQVRRAYFSLGRLLVAEGERERGEALLAKYKHAEQAAVAESGAAITHTEKGIMADSELSSLAAAAPPPPEADAPGRRAERQAEAAAETKLHALLASTLNDLGTAEARQHDYATALADFQQSERWDANNPVVLRNLGTAAFRVKNSAEAMRALKLYSEKQTDAGQPVEPHAQLLLALSEFDLGQFSAAAASFAAAGSTAVEEPSTAYSYAFSLAHSGHAQEANRIADNLTAKPLSPELLPLVCHLYIDTENYTGSQTCYRKALEASPNLTLAHYEIGESLIRLDRPAEAIPELRKELTHDADNPNVRTALAFALLQTSQKSEARAVLKGTVETHPEHAEAQYEYGKLLLEEGQIPDSIVHLAMSEKADPSKDYVHYQLGTAYKKAGQTSDAEREFKVYRQIKDQTRDAAAVPH